MPFFIILFSLSGILQGVFLSGYFSDGNGYAHVPARLLAHAPEKPLVVPRAPVSPPAPLPQKPIVISFAGDVMLDRHIRNMGEAYGYPHILASTTSLFEESDFIVLNLEGPITHHASKSVGTKNGDAGHYTFTFAPRALGAFFGEPSRWIFSLGNNHILNFGQEGLAETKRAVAEGGFSFFGAPDDEYTPLVKKVGETTLSFLSYNQFTGQDPARTREAITRAASSSDAVIVFAHWDEEYQNIPTKENQALAHGFVDAGASLVVGAHPHVVQSKERYHDAFIYYSLGNFVFDQYFSPEVKCGAVVHAIFSPALGEITFRETFIELSPDGATRASACMREIPVL